MDVRVGPWRKLSAEELILLNCGVGEDSGENLLDCRDIQPFLPKGNQSWISLEGLMLKLKLQYLHHLSEELTHLKRPWFWGRLKVGGEGDNRRWNGWLASPTRWTWVWGSSRSWWWTGRPGMLQSMGLQRARHDWVTGLNSGKEGDKKERRRKMRFKWKDPDFVGNDGGMG